MFTFETKKQTKQDVLEYFRDHIPLRTSAESFDEINETVSRVALGEYVDALVDDGVKYIFLKKDEGDTVQCAFLTRSGTEDSESRPGVSASIRYFGTTGLFKETSLIKALDERHYYLCLPTEFAEDAETAMKKNSYDPIPVAQETGLDWVYYPFEPQGYEERLDPIFTAESKVRSIHIPFVTVTDRHGEFYAKSDIPETSRFRAGYRRDADGYFRSSWEANVARILDYKNIPYEYEKQPYALETVHYLPDFFLGGGIILEVKGVWDADSRKKVLQFTKNITDFKLLPIDQDVYIDLKRQFSDSLPVWEDDGSPRFQRQEVAVVGLTFFRAQLREGMNLRFFREPDNEYDGNAILATGEDGTPIGHLSAEWAAIYAPKMDAGMKYRGVVKELTSKVMFVDMERENKGEIILYDLFK